MKLSITSLLLNTCLVTAMAVSHVNAQEVEIQTLDGSIRLKGELLDYDGTFLSIATALGEMRVDSANVICTGAACPAVGAKFVDFTMSGSRVLTDTLIPGLLTNYAANREATNTLVSNTGAATVFQLDSELAGSGEIRIAAGDTEAGLSDLFNGNSVLALASRSPDKSEIGLFDVNRLGNLKSIEQENILALNALVLVTHPDNPVHSISEEVATRVFAGQIANWKELGGDDRPIVLHGRDTGTGTSEMFEDLVMRESGLPVNRAMTLHDSDEAVANAVLADEGAIGFTTFAQLGEANALDIEEACGLRTPATPFTIKSEEYPYSQVLYAYRTSNAFEPGVADFIDFIVSDTGQNAVASLGLVDQKIVGETVNEHGFRLATAVATSETQRDLNALQDMLVALQTAERLSTTFRFNTGSSNLNARAEADIIRLVSYLETTNMTGKEVVIVGFTDSIGKSELNEFLSQRRAELVMQSIFDASPELANNVNFRAVGFGEIAPVGCNESNRGRTINRRVEVWVRDVAG